jgi:hypothetical protein
MRVEERNIPMANTATGHPEMRARTGRLFKMEKFSTGLEMSDQQKKRWQNKHSKCKHEK